LTYPAPCPANSVRVETRLRRMPMQLVAREMVPAEVDLVIDYFRHTSPEHLERLGVDPTRLPAPDVWREHFHRECARPPEQRARYNVIWLLDGSPVGYSSCNKIAVGFPTKAAFSTAFKRYSQSPGESAEHRGRVSWRSEFEPRTQALISSCLHPLKPCSPIRGSSTTTHSGVASAPRTIGTVGRASPQRWPTPDRGQRARGHSRRAFAAESQ
jgi:hypothetical protein